MAPTPDPKTLSDDDLRSHIKTLGLDPIGSRTSLLERLSRHLKSQQKSLQNGTATTNGKSDKKKVRRSKKKKGTSNPVPDSTASESEPQTDNESVANGVEIEYVAPVVNFGDDPAFSEYAQVFAKFAPAEPTTDTEAGAEKADDDMDIADDDDNTTRKEGDAEGAGADGAEAMDEDESPESLSRKKQRKLQRLSVAELKQLVRKPEVVDWVDVTAADPKLLVNLKSYRNSVPVPVHWQQKRKYLQGKRGIEKPPFELPDFIKQTGIMELRSAVKEKEEASKLKSKTRERHQPKMGKIDIDYQKLHDAFFRWQTKPKLTIHGDLYYEGKEFETKLKQKRPGQLSEELKQALAIPPLAPPPWLINMQRYGPPPSYPQLKIPGLNAPIPEGAQWGFHPGGWGKPPVDEYNRPLYGDVFGTLQVEVPQEFVAEIEKAPWGELEAEEEEEEVEEEEEEQEEEEEDGGDGGLPSGLVTPSGISSVPSGLETPEHIELRKEARRRSPSPPRNLYTILPERQTSVQGFMGSTHTYDLSSSDSSSRKRKADQVDVALNPEDMEEGIDADVLKRKYEAQMEGRRAEGRGEDLSDMVAEHVRKGEKKRKEGKKDKKGKEFKF
ncbi:hypothetical protein HK097_005640 [Rhizophlyctis rosea]|uniref:SAP domain-containing protein n=1 Tax=Rhizophlyctis rosea TaxID=64517 RepID=A0AAD5X613_9FUNG|nr:hypothetical protein HK097_005640 [Rhizophlyctis rosea]